MALHWKIIIGLIAGICWALFSSWVGLSEFTIKWIDPFGTIFINLLKMIAVPLILFSIISGISGLPDTSQLGRMGMKTIVAYIGTTVLAVSTGLLLVNTFQPGKSIDQDQRIDNRIMYELWAAEENIEVLDGNCMLCDDKYSEKTKRIRASGAYAEMEDDVKKRMETAESGKKAGPLKFLVDMVPGNIFQALGTNTLMLQVIFFALFFGITLSFIPKDKAAPVIAFVDGANAVFLKMVDFIMQAAPFFVFALLAGVVSKMAGDNPAAVLEIFKGLSWYSLIVVLGLGMLIFVFYPLFISIWAKSISYFDFLKGISSAQTLAFSTSSSAATLPVTMECVEDNLGVSRQVSSFVLPIGATLNMDGTSLYQAVAVVFLAQMHMVDLSLGQQLTIVLTATLASIGSAAVPSAGLVMLIIVLQSVGLNPAWIAIIFPVDRILDMCRTTANVTGDAMVSTLIAQSEGQFNPKTNRQTNQ
ncbi:MAG: dicarboxylate/amino acid:cation symporter [Chitinophagales bacterium]